MAEAYLAQAGLRKLGHASPRDVRLAVLEETEHLSVIPQEDPADAETQGGARADALLPRNT